jgi:homoserine kinase
MDRFTVQVPASASNLGPGFDTLGLALQLYLKVGVRSRWDGRRKISYRGLGASILKDESESLLAKAINFVWNELGFSGLGYELDVQNEIPLASGLGSSASAIVAGIEIACRLAKSKLTIAEKVKLGYAMEGHPDNIIPALTGGFVIALTNSDGHVDWIRFTFPNAMKIVVATPEFSVATRTAREILPRELAREDMVFNLQRLAALSAALSTGRWPGELAIMDDRMHQPYRSELVPGLEGLLSMKPSKDLLGIALCGSGPSVIALVRGKAQEIGRLMSQEFSKAGYRSTVRYLKSDNRGARMAAPRK